MYVIHHTMNTTWSMAYIVESDVTSLFDIEDYVRDSGLAAIRYEWHEVWLYGVMSWMQVIALYVMYAITLFIETTTLWHYVMTLFVGHKVQFLSYNILHKLYIVQCGKFCSFMYIIKCQLYYKLLTYCTPTWIIFEICYLFACIRYSYIKFNYVIYYLNSIY